MLERKSGHTPNQTLQLEKEKDSLAKTKLAELHEEGIVLNWIVENMEDSSWISSTKVPKYVRQGPGVLREPSKSSQSPFTIKFWQSSSLASHRAFWIAKAKSWSSPPSSKLVSHKAAKTNPEESLMMMPKPPTWIWDLQCTATLILDTEMFGGCHFWGTLEKCSFETWIRSKNSVVRLPAWQTKSRAVTKCSSHNLSFLAIHTFHASVNNNAMLGEFKLWIP